ncbi:MAG: hypothetical protein ABI878_12015, partial [Acidobacteriota bacterium]
LENTLKRLTPDLYSRSPVVSPDGKYLAYSQIDRDKESVWLKDIASGATVQLLPPVDLDQSYNVLHFSPDGTRLFYSSHASDGRNLTIYRYTLATHEQTRIADDDISPSAISPDGQELAFIDSKYDLIEVSSDGGDEKVLRRPQENKWLVAWNSEMSWSPDGRSILMCGGHTDNGRNIGDVVQFDVASGDEHRLKTPDNWQQIDDVVSLADGVQILVTARQTQADPFQIYKVAEDGTTARLTNDDHDYRWIGASRDGSFIAAEQGLDHFNIWSAPFSDTKDLRQLTFGSSARDGFDGLAFMPDGRIVYSATRSGAVDLWIMNPDGGSQTQLTINAGSWNARPRVSPDGRHIVFSSNRTGVTQLWRMDADGGSQTQLTTSTDAAFRANITPDGKFIYYNTENDGSIWKIPIDGGEPVLESKEKCLFPSISPDGKQLACINVEKSQPNSWRVDVVSAVSGELVRTYNFPVGRSILIWTPDSRALISMNLNFGNLFEHPVDGSPARALTSFTADRLPFFAVSPDNKRIAFSRGNSYSEAVQIIRPISAVSN